MTEALERNSVMVSVKNQVYSTIIACLILFCFGSSMGWLSPSLPILLSENTPLKTGPLTNEQLSWIGAVNSVGAIIGTFITGFFSMTIGSKRAITILAFPSIVFWLLVHFGDTYLHILIARFSNGLIGGGFQSGVVLYISEISNDNVRGRLGSIVPLSRNLGVLISFIVAAFTKYEYRPYVFIVFPIIYLVWVCFLPSTPQFYLKKGQFQNAEKSLMFYKNCKVKEMQEKCEGQSYQEQLFITAEFERLKSIEEDRQKNAKIRLKDFCNRAAIKGFTVAIAMSWFFQCTACYVFTNYTSMIFKISGSALSLDASGIILAVVQIIGALVSTQLGDAFSRKTTLYISLIGSAIGLFIFAAFSYMNQNGYAVEKYLWVPIASSSFTIFISAAGIVALSSTCTVENFPPKIRTAGMVFYSLSNNSIALLAEKFFPFLLETIFLHGFMLFLAINCCIGLLFVACLKETKGKSLDSIDKS